MIEPRARVVLLAEYISSGGTRTYVERLIRFYARRGAQVTMVHTWASLDEAMAALADELGVVLVPYTDVNPGETGEDPWGSKALAPVWSPWSVLRERRRFREFFLRTRPDYVVASVGTPGMFLGASGAVPAATYILHTYPHGLRTRYLGPWLLHQYIPSGIRIVAVSEFQARAIREHWGLHRQPERVTVVPSTAGPTMAADVLAPEPVVLTAAGLVDYKRPLDWIRVAEAVGAEQWRVPPRFEWIGEGPLLDQARVAASSGTASKRIAFDGLASDVDPYYSRCVLYLQLSGIENLSLSVLDALRRGIPCVVTDVGGLPELVTDGVTGHVVPVGDIGAAARAVSDLLSSPELRVSMGQAALRDYSERFAPEVWETGLAAAHVRLRVSPASSIL